MRFSTSPKARMLLSLVTSVTLIGAFMVTGVLSSPVAYASSSSSVSTFQGKHGVEHLAYSGHLNLSSSMHQASRVQPLVPFGGHHGAISSAEVQRNAPLTASTAMGSDAGRVLHNFNGLSNVDQFSANGFVLEPPDQGLCVGNLSGTKVVGEIINDVVAFYTPNGSLFSGVENLNTFFSEPTDLNISDPRCYYDVTTNAWFFTVVVYTNTLLPNHSDLLVLHPNLKTDVYQFDTTNPGNAAGLCPCFGDQPKLGIDKNNVYITVDQFGGPGQSIETGDTLFAISKSQVVAGASTVDFAEFNNLALAGIPIVTLQPAITNSNVDKEFLLNSFPYDARGDNNTFSRTLGLWSLSNTGSVTSGGVPTLSATAITSELYAFPTAALATNGLSLATFTNDSRMQQVQYINGQLWGALDTALLFKGSPVAFDGIAWFEIHPNLDSSGMIAGATFTHQGYVGSPGNYLIYPAIEHTAEGTTGIAFSLTNPTLNPSTGYVVSNSDSVSFGDVHITGVGSGPDIGFACTAGFPQQCRWGDYSSATLDPNGQNIWMAAEYIVPQTSTGVFNGAPAPINWGTRVWNVTG